MKRRKPHFFMRSVKSDQCSSLKARMSRTELGNHDNVFSAWIAANKLARSSLAVVQRLPCTRKRHADVGIRPGDSLSSAKLEPERKKEIPAERLPGRVECGRNNTHQLTRFSQSSELLV